MVKKKAFRRFTFATEGMLRMTIWGITGDAGDSSSLIWTINDSYLNGLGVL